MYCCTSYDVTNIILYRFLCTILTPSNYHPIHIIHVYAHVHTYTHTHIYTHTYTYVCEHTHTHMLIIALLISSLSLSSKQAMKSPQLLVSAVLLSIILSLSTAAPVYQLGEEWHLWKAENEKMYTSDREELERHLIWLSNKKYIDGHNANKDIFGYTLAMNQYGDMVRAHQICTCIQNIHHLQ